MFKVRFNLMNICIFFYSFCQLKVHLTMFERKKWVMWFDFQNCNLLWRHNRTYTQIYAAHAKYSLIGLNCIYIFCNAQFLVFVIKTEPTIRCEYTTINFTQSNEIFSTTKGSIILEIKYSGYTTRHGKMSWQMCKAKRKILFSFGW